MSLSFVVPASGTSGVTSLCPWQSSMLEGQTFEGQGAKNPPKIATKNAKTLKIFLTTEAAGSILVAGSPSMHAAGFPAHVVTAHALV